MRCLVIVTLSLWGCGPAEEAADDGVNSEAEALVVKHPKPGEFAGAFPSPSIVRVGKVLHAFFPRESIELGGKRHTFNVTHATFEDGKWSAPSEALPQLGAGALQGGPVWAPAAARIDSTHWMLYYTAQIDQPGTQKKCIWRAHAKTPEGPFVDDFGGPLVCSPQGDSTWSIDPYVVQDARGFWNLAARIDLGGTLNSIQVRRLGPFGRHFAADSQWFQLAQNHIGSWDHHVMENAGLVRLGPGNGATPHWFVFYSAREWQNNSYSIGYADCGENIDGLTGAGCVKKTTSDPWLQTNATEGLFGPGTPTFYSDGNGGDLMSIQAWRFSDGETGANAAKNRAQGAIMKTYAIEVDGQYRPHMKLLRTDL